MKLKTCHITGFGKINDRSFDFNNGLNVFCEENGFGKSTLASFIKVMLYGFEGSSLTSKESSFSFLPKVLVTSYSFPSYSKVMLPP